MVLENQCLHRRLNYDICTAFDMTKIGIVLDQMVAEGVIHANLALAFRVQASGLLASIRGANDQAFGITPATPNL